MANFYSYWLSCCGGAQTFDLEISGPRARRQANFAEELQLLPGEGSFAPNGRPEPRLTSLAAGSSGNGPLQLPLNIAGRQDPSTRTYSSSSGDSQPDNAMRGETTFSPKLKPTTSLTSQASSLSPWGPRQNMSSMDSMAPQRSGAGKTFSTASVEPPDRKKMSSLDSMKAQRSMLPISGTIDDSMAAQTGRETAAHDIARDRPWSTNGRTSIAMPQIAKTAAMNSGSEDLPSIHQMTPVDSLMPQHSEMAALPMEGMMSSASSLSNKLSTMKSLNIERAVRMGAL